MRCGLVLLPGNNDSAMNYPANPYHFRQDSSFLYFFGINLQGLTGVIDVDNNHDYIFGNDLEIDDIIWTGPQPTVSELAALAGVDNTDTTVVLSTLLQTEIAKGRKVHFLPPYRAERKLQIEALLGINSSVQKNYVSVELIKAIVSLRSYKEDIEVAEMERISHLATYDMHTEAMKMSKNTHLFERDIFGRMEGIALAGGGAPSFPIIVTINGQTLHNHYHGNPLKAGRLMIVDAGAESEMGYATDITRTTPVGGKFTQKQKDIYNIVLKAEVDSIAAIKPGVPYLNYHLGAAKIIAAGLKDLGLMKGNVDDAVAQGAHTLFFPHGLGHMMGLDVHDMEDYGENYVGYNDQFVRSKEFGLGYLRLARNLEPRFVLTVEPGIYFIPELIDIWKKENKCADFINYSKVSEYIDFGGIRIEDDVFVTENGGRVIGKPIPKTVDDIEALIASAV